jgi:DNA-binding CsgD family transcriptional regulator
MNAILAPRADSAAPPPVLLHDHPPSVLRPPPTHRPALPTPLARLLAAENTEERRRVVDEMLSGIGCDWLAYGALVPSRVGSVRPVSMCTAHADPQWIRHYCAEGYFDVDPRLGDAAHSSLPVTWTLEQLEDGAVDAPARASLRRFVADLAATGMRGGAILALPGEPDGRRHFISLLARRPDPRLLAGEMIGQVLTLGLCLHELYTRYSGLPGQADPAAALTPVQREILGHVARGESDKRIAYHLRISSHAVDYHMRQLRNRFAVRNRVQLAQASRVLLGA